MLLQSTLSREACLTVLLLAKIDLMNLTINGENRILSAAATLSGLIAQLGMKPDRVAIELNREIVPRERWAETALQDGDRLEIVQFVGGGY